MSERQVLGIGTDIIEIERVAAAIRRHGNRFLDRIFTDKEQEYARSRGNSNAVLAGRFAAKEAVSKALGTGIGHQVSWRAIEILNDPSGKPLVFLSSTAATAFCNPIILVSISHCRAYATALAINYRAP